MGALVQDGHDHHHVPAEPGQFRADEDVPFAHPPEGFPQRTLVQSGQSGYLFFHPAVHVQVPSPAPFFYFIPLTFARLHLRADTDVRKCHCFLTVFQHSLHSRLGCIIKRPFRTVGQHQLENHCFFVFPCRRNRKEPDFPAHPGGAGGQEGSRRTTGPAEGEVKAAEGLRADASGTQEGEGGRGIFQTVSGKGGDSQKHPVQVLESHKRGGTKRTALKI